MKMDKRYLPVYKKWSKAKEQTTEMHLCNYFTHGDYLLNLIKPTESDEDELWREDWPTFAWGHGDTSKRYKDYKPGHPFTPLRRNLLLLMAAMNGELK